ncbi:hypothetical protein ILUMI_13062 [Ignelater luminosus]|uniref:BTB domain-containing protein n=1 Tax=Ignelater luminosus TaxID=2038154 RepID=A0A8K0CWX7_IGNLU|nr:hypothetical protein ILUMI_13062 [Ignelater luminosus]
MPISKKSKKLDLLDMDVGTVSEDLEVPVASEVVFRKVWRIRNFKKIVSKRDFLDSPEFRCSVNGMSTYWNVSVRFWKGPNGKKISNPLVLCLNLTGCETEETGQARVRYQFGIWDASIRYWEFCDISNIILNLENTNELLSIGYKTLGVHDRHIDNDKNVRIMVKVQIIQSEEEKHSLSQDLARVLANESKEYCDTIVECATQNGEEPFKVNSLLIKARSPKLGVMLQKYKDPKNENIRYKLDLSVLSYDVVRELLRYIYTDKVDNTDTHANKLLPLSTRFNLPGLTALCERTLLESMTPNNVPNILLLADQYGCENLRKAALQYCEDTEAIKGSVQMGKSLAWRVMEMVNPDLFLEACESIGSSSSTLDDSPGSYSDGFEQ